MNHIFVLKCIHFSCLDVTPCRSLRTLAFFGLAKSGIIIILLKAFLLNRFEFSCILIEGSFLQVLLESWCRLVINWTSFVIHVLMQDICKLSWQKVMRRRQSRLYPEEISCSLSIRRFLIFLWTECAKNIFLEWISMEYRFTFFFLTLMTNTFIAIKRFKLFFLFIFIN